MTLLEEALYAGLVLLAVGAVRLLWALWRQVGDHRPSAVRRPRAH